MTRKPIYLNHSTIMLIEVFHKGIDDFSELHWKEYINNVEEYHGVDSFKIAAEEFISQLKGQACIHFYNELIKELLKEINDQDKKYDTDHLDYTLSIIRGEYK